MSKKYIVRLTEEERDQLKELVTKGKAAAYKIRHANILLSVDIEGSNWTDFKAAQAYGCHINTVQNIRQRLVESSLEMALERKAHAVPPREKILDGEKEAKLIALRCGEPPKGYANWTLRLLSDKFVEMKIVDSISHETVRQALKKTNSDRICANVG